MTDLKDVARRGIELAQGDGMDGFVRWRGFAVDHFARLAKAYLAQQEELERIKLDRDAWRDQYFVDTEKEEMQILRKMADAADSLRSEFSAKFAEKKYDAHPYDFSVWFTICQALDAWRALKKIPKT